MNPIEQADLLFEQHYTCSQSVLGAYAGLLGMAPELALRLAMPFGAGMGRQGEVCGAVTGALMAIGLLSGSAVIDKEAKERTYRLTLELLARFQADQGALRCRDLLGCDLTQPEGRAKAQDDGLFDLQCPVYVHRAAEILSELIASSGLQSSEPVVREAGNL
jgi:C_GCAxxG_C_C family probable redox protein